MSAMNGEGFVNANAQPKWVYVFSLTLALAAMGVLVFCFTARFMEVRSFKRLSLVRWLVMAIYIDSFLFVFSSTVLQSGFGLNGFPAACSTAILLCLICYLSSKILYLFLVEKVYIIRGRRKLRKHDRLYLFNTVGIVLPYLVVIALTFFFRISFIKEASGACYIGMKLGGNIPLLCFDVVINVYLTALFLVPLTNLHSYKQYNNSTPKLKNIARRTFFCSFGTLLVTVANLTALIILRGIEPGWLCFACCNADVLVSALLLHWVTRTDKDDDTLYASSPASVKKLAPGSPLKVKNEMSNASNNVFSGEVFSNCVAGPPNFEAAAKKTKHKSMPLNAIPVGRIGCTTETTQETVERESFHGSEDRMNPSLERRDSIV